MRRFGYYHTELEVLDVCTRIRAHLRAGGAREQIEWANSQRRKMSPDSAVRDGIALFGEVRGPDFSLQPFSRELGQGERWHGSVDPLSEGGSRMKLYRTIPMMQRLQLFGLVVCSFASFLCERQQDRLGAVMGAVFIAFGMTAWYRRQPKLRAAVSEFLESELGFTAVDNDSAGASAPSGPPGAPRNPAA